MILHRISEAIRTQNWFTVSIEFLIVVGGIFVGLQVDDWNETRKNKVQETVYLQQLLEDFKAMAEFNKPNPSLVKIRDGALLALNALHSCELKEAERGMFEYPILRHQAVIFLVVRRSTYDEMLSSGAFARLTNTTLKGAIADYFTGMENRNRNMEYFVRELNRVGEIFWQSVRFHVKSENPEGRSSDGSTNIETGVTITYEFDKLCNNLSFVNAVVEIVDNSNDRILFGNEVVANAKNVIDLLEEDLATRR